MTHVLNVGLRVEHSIVGRPQVLTIVVECPLDWDSHPRSSVLNADSVVTVASHQPIQTLYSVGSNKRTMFSGPYATAEVKFIGMVDHMHIAVCGQVIYGPGMDVNQIYGIDMPKPPEIEPEFFDDCDTLGAMKDKLFGSRDE